MIIPCHGGADDTLSCIASLRAQTASPLLNDLEILVVDNGSPDDTGARAREAGATVVDLESNRGFAGGVNAGLAAARGELLILLNNDTLAAPTLLTRLIEPLLADARIGLTAPVSNRVKGPAQIATGRAGESADSRSEIEAVLRSHTGACNLEDAFTLSGLCLAMRRETAQRVGDWDERFGLGNFEDDDFCLRTRLLGYRTVIVRDAFLHHHGSRTFTALGIDYRRNLAEQQVLFEDKWRHDPAGASLLARMRDDRSAEVAHAAAARERHPDWCDADYVLGRWYHEHQDGAAARTHLRRFLARCPHHTEAWLLLAAELHRSAGIVVAERCLAEALTSCYVAAPMLGHALSLRGCWLLEAGQTREATRAFGEALELIPDHPRLHWLLGRALWAEGNLTLALPHLATAAASGESGAQVDLGAAQWQAGLAGEALRTMARAVAAHPGDVRARDNLAAALQVLDTKGLEVGRAARLFDELPALPPGTSSIAPDEVNDRARAVAGC